MLPSSSSSRHFIAGEGKLTPGFFKAEPCLARGIRPDRVGARSEVTLLSNRSPIRRTPLALLMLIITLIAGTALAAGRIEWKSKNFKERSDKSWLLEFAVYLPRAPDVAYVPMKFEFQPEVYYERSLIDGHDGPPVMIHSTDN